MQKTVTGFTLVELLIVIVIISMLAGISVVSYRGVQDRAKDSQTQNAASQWMKALQNYKVRNGSLPNTSTCLGIDYKYNVDGTGASGTGQCRQDGASNGITTNNSVITSLQKYMTGNPTPAMLTESTSSTNWARGAYYYVDTSLAPTSGVIGFTLSSNSNGCPGSFGGITRLRQTQGTASPKAYLCEYSLGSISSY